MHDALESQFIPIRKAIHVDLICKCGVFSCANPVKGIFDKSKDIVSQINLMPSLLSRFDLTFVLIDKVNKKEDEIVFNHILKSFENIDIEENKGEDFLEVEFIKKYLFYCKINNNPEFTSLATDLLKTYAHKMRSKCEDLNYKFNARELNALVRLCISYAKLTFKNKVDKECINFATSLYTRCMRSLGVDFYDSVLAAEYNLLEKNILEFLSTEKDISFEDLMNLCKDNNLKYSIKDLESKIKKLKSSGQIAEFKKGKYRKL
jgi:replicative DNA helicase Mcm